MIGKSSLIGAAGEYYVMSELLHRGVIGALAPEGVPTIDILVSSPLGNRLASIQVKTRRTIVPAASWPMNEKHENISSDMLFYCFVNMFDVPDKKPETFVVPSKVVAKLMKLSHVTWLSGKKKNGEARKDTPMRSFSRSHSNLNGLTSVDYSAGWLEQYRERWDLLELELVKN
tara:strand:- start:1507 stop:2025 length:519 start_codon:yes stop_codon:yes gene_type:complete